MPFVEAVVESVLTISYQGEQTEPDIVWSKYAQPPQQSQQQKASQQSNAAEEETETLEPNVIEKGIRQCVFTGMQYVVNDALLSGGQAATPLMYTCCVASKPFRRYAFCKVCFHPHRDGATGFAKVSCLTLVSPYAYNSAMSRILQDLTSIYMRDYNEFQQEACSLVQNNTLEENGVFKICSNYQCYSNFAPAFAGRTSSGTSLVPLLQCFDARGLILLFTACLCERRVLLVSQSVPCLTSCMMGILELLYPFTWPHIFIPILSHSQLENVCAPSPFLIGLLPDQLRRAEEEFGPATGDLVIVWIDRGLVFCPSNSRSLVDLSESYWNHTGDKNEVRWHDSSSSVLSKPFPTDKFTTQDNFLVIRKCRHGVKRLKTSLINSNDGMNACNLLVQRYMYHMALLASDAFQNQPWSPSKSGATKLDYDPWSTDQEIENAFGSDSSTADCADFITQTTGSVLKSDGKSRTPPSGAYSEAPPRKTGCKCDSYFDIYSYLRELHKNVPTERSTTTSKFSQQLKQTMKAGKRFKYKIQTSWLANRIAKEKKNLLSSKKSFIQTSNTTSDDSSLWKKVVHESLHSGESPGFRLYRELQDIYKSSHASGWLDDLEHSVRATFLAFNCLMFGKCFAFVQLPGEGDTSDEAFMCRLDKDSFLRQCSRQTAPFLSEALESQMILEFSALEREYETCLDIGSNPTKQFDTYTLWNLLYHRVSLRPKCIPQPCDPFSVFKLTSARRLPENSTFGTLKRTTLSLLEELSYAWFHLNSQVINRHIIQRVDGKSAQYELCSQLMKVSSGWYSDSGLSGTAIVGGAAVNIVEPQSKPPGSFVRDIIADQRELCFVCAQLNPEKELARSLQTVFHAQHFPVRFWRSICQWLVSFCSYSVFCDAILASIMEPLIFITFNYGSLNLGQLDILHLKAATRALALAHVILLYGPERAFTLLMHLRPLLLYIIKRTDESLLNSTKFIVDMLKSCELERVGLILRFLQSVDKEGRTDSGRQRNISPKLSAECSSTWVLNTGVQELETFAHFSPKENIFDRPQYLAGAPLPAATFEYGTRETDDVGEDEKEELLVELEIWAARIVRLIGSADDLEIDFSLYRYLLTPHQRSPTKKATEENYDTVKVENKTPPFNKLHQNLKSMCGSDTVSRKPFSAGQISHTEFFGGRKKTGQCESEFHISTNNLDQNEGGLEDLFGW